MNIPFNVGYGKFDVANQFNEVNIAIHIPALQDGQNDLKIIIKINSTVTGINVHLFRKSPTLRVGAHADPKKL